MDLIPTLMPRKALDANENVPQIIVIGLQETITLDMKKALLSKKPEAKTLQQWQGMI